ncbi:MAG: threonine--tRNA ligase [Candidatus Cloacimonadota bacterium]|nr:MAG: threonine--tRNA ligase [Candidatus Cloacimonadota bacterium]
MKIKIDLNGTKEIDVEKGTTALEIFTHLNPQSNRKPIAARFNGSLIDLSLPIEDEGILQYVTFDDEEGKFVYWHSTSHVMAQAVKRLFPDAKLAIGPAISDGFYYDFYTKKTFSPDDMKKIEKEMKKIIKEGQSFERTVISKDEAISLFTEEKENFKLELINELEGDISIYKNAEFVDLCRGPHVPRTSYISAYKLLSISGSYWRGDEKRESLQRIYGVSFETKEELKKHLHKLQEAKERDHRKLGKELGLFSTMGEAGPGLILWHPKGATLRRIIEDYWKDEHLKKGYELVITPHIAKSGLWRTSGHYDYYLENMFTFKINNNEYVIKPMNCPGHILIYKSKIHSYRDLPIRYAELGTVARNELSGVLHGLLRVQEFTQDDAHIFCMEEQIEDEILGVLRFARSIMNTFGFQNLNYELSVRDPDNKDKYAGFDKDWEKAEASLVKALEAEKLDYKRMEGEAVFYGPKIDIQMYDALGRKWQGPTIQFDFNLPGRFDVTYVGKDGNQHNVFIVHRTILGSIERFIGTLIEHYKGDFPVWLSPVQVRIMTITDKSIDYAERVNNTLIPHHFRTEVDKRNEKIDLKVREAEKERIPYMAIIGEREEKENTVSIRERHRKNRGSFSIVDLIEELNEKCKKKT